MMSVLVCLNLLKDICISRLTEISGFDYFMISYYSLLANLNQYDSHYESRNFTITSFTKNVVGKSKITSHMNTVKKSQSYDSRLKYREIMVYGIPLRGSGKVVVFFLR